MTATRSAAPRGNRDRSNYGDACQDRRGGLAVLAGDPLFFLGQLSFAKALAVSDAAPIVLDPSTDRLAIGGLDLRSRKFGSMQRPRVLPMGQDALVGTNTLRGRQLDQGIGSSLRVHRGRTWVAFVDRSDCFSFKLFTGRQRRAKQQTLNLRCVDNRRDQLAVLHGDRVWSRIFLDLTQVTGELSNAAYGRDMTNSFVA